MKLLLDATFQTIEKTLNGFGHIPIISSVTAPFRHLLGQSQFWGGFVVGVISLPFNSRQFERGIEIATHGVANMVRSGVEEIPFVNMATILYDASNRFEYNSLKDRQIIVVAYDEVPL
jgi:hypothetical protein